MKGGVIGVFLDRDGTVNEERDYVRTPDDLHLIHGAAAAVRRLNKRGVKTCIVSNQSGVARGFLTEDDLQKIHDRLKETLAAEGAYVDRIYYCPHHPTAGISPYDVECECRKPAVGMLERGERELGIDLSQSYVVGDSLVDMQAGTNAGTKAVLVLTGYGERTRSQLQSNGIQVNYIAASIVEAVNFILNDLSEEH